MGLILKVVRDWLPAVLGLAITTGIAPLLFLQILYKRQFYTANLLLFNRFMLLLPALIVAYYMLYLIKSHALAGRGPMLRGLVAIVAFACFFYTAWAWTENHVLSLHEEAWKDQYASSSYLYRNAEIWPRLGYWITASFATLAVALAWQLHWGRRLHDPVDLDLASRRLRSLAILGLATSAAEAWLWQLWLDTPAREAVASKLAFPYGLVALAGMGVQFAGWLTGQTGASAHHAAPRADFGRRNDDDPGDPGGTRGEAPGGDRHHGALRRASPGGTSGRHGRFSRVFRCQCRGDHGLRLDRQTSARAAKLRSRSALFVRRNISWLTPKNMVNSDRISHSSDREDEPSTF